MRNDLKKVTIRVPTADVIDAFRRELENVLQRRVYMREAIEYAFSYARGNAEKIVQHETDRGYFHAASSQDDSDSQANR